MLSISRRYAFPLVSFAALALITMIIIDGQRAIAGDYDVRYYNWVANQIVGPKAVVASAFRSGYPPIATLLFFAAKLNPYNLPLANGLMLLLLVFYICTVLYCVGWLKPKDARWIAIAFAIDGVLFGPIMAFGRFDLFIALLLFLVWKCMDREKYASSGFLLAIGVLLKFSPVFLVPLTIASTPRGKRLRVIGGMCGGGFVSIALYLWFLGGERLVQNMAFAISIQRQYGIHVFSTLSGLDALAKSFFGLKPHLFFLMPNLGDFNGDFPHWFSAICLIAAVTGSLWIAYRALIRRDKDHADPRFVIHMSMVLCWLLFTNGMMNLHYYQWFIPLVLIWVFEQGSRNRSISWNQATIIAFIFIIAFCSTYLFPARYLTFANAQPFTLMIVNNMRNAAVLGLFLTLLHSTRHGIVSTVTSITRKK